MKFHPGISAQLEAKWSQCSGPCCVSCVDFALLVSLFSCESRQWAAERGRTDVWCLDAPMFVWRFLPDQWLVTHLWAQSATQANIIGQQEQQTEQRRMKTLALRMAFAHCNMWKITVSFNDCTNTEHALSISRCMFPVYLKWLLFMATLEKRSYILMPLLLSS